MTPAASKPPTNPQSHTMRIVKTTVISIETPPDSDSEWSPILPPTPLGQINYTKAQPSAYKWQPKAFEKLKESMLRLISAPTGSGKSILICALAVHDLKNGYKVLLTVPQRAIADSFTKGMSFTLPGGVSGQWTPGITHECINKVDEIVRFLKKTPLPNDPRGNTLLCTHAAFVAAVKKLGPKNIVKTSVFIDETHHCQVGIDEAKEKDEDKTNGLGGAIQPYLGSNPPGPLTLVTATWMRSIGHIVGDHLGRFTKYSYYMDEHLRNAFGPGTCITVNFYVGNEFECLKHIINENRTQPTITYIPPYIRGDLKGPYVEKCKKAFGKLRYVDLVDDSDLTVRNEKMVTLRKDIDLGVGPDQILSLDMCKEGFNYSELSRVILMAPRSSMRDTLQMSGRTFRASHGKKYIELNIILNVESSTDPGKISDYLKVMFASMVVDWAFRRTELITHLRSKGISKENSEKVADVDLSDMEDILNGTAKASIANNGDKDRTDKATHNVIKNQGKKTGNTFLTSDVGSEAVRVAIDFFDQERVQRMLKDADDVPMVIDLKKRVSGCIEMYASGLGFKDLEDLRIKTGTMEAKEERELEYDPSLIPTVPTHLTTLEEQLTFIVDAYSATPEARALYAYYSSKGSP